MSLLIVDVWDTAPPPEAGCDDDTLLGLASEPDRPTIVIGDSGAIRRASDFGLAPVAHVAVPTRSAWLGHRRLARLLDDLGRPVCDAASGFARNFAERSGAILTPSRHPRAGGANFRGAEQRRYGGGPLIVPIADHPCRIPAADLLSAAAVLDAGGTGVRLLLPTQTAGFARARSRASNADRQVRVIPTDRPAFRFIPSSACVIRFGADAAGAQAELARSCGVPVIDGRDRHSPLSLAIAVRQALKIPAAG